MSTATSPASTRPDTYFPLTVADGVRTSAERTPHKTALIEGDRSLTYAELVKRVHQVGNLFKEMIRLPAGAHVGILAPNCLEFVEVVTGLAGAGYPVATLSARSPAHELIRVAEDAQLQALVVHPSLEEVARSLPIPADNVFVLGELWEQRLARSSATRPDVRPEEWDTMVIHYTSGTTGAPKGVLCSHRSRVLNYLAMASEYGCYGPDDHALAIAPLYHGAGLSFALAPLFTGGRTTILERFKPEQVLELLAKNEATNAFMVPTHFHALFALGEDRVRAARGDRLKTIICNAAPLPQSMKERIVDVFGAGVLYECYGSTEGGVVSNLRPSDQLRKESSVGLPFPGTSVRLLGEDGEEVGPGEVGELFSISPYLFNGYWNKPAETAETLRDGWFSAGDLAIRDEEGFLYLVGRKSEKIISGGLNVYPREVEEALVSHPAVYEAAVFGMPDDRWGEAVRAAVVLVPGAAVEPEALISHARELVASYKVPQAIEFRVELPRNAAGKVLRRTLQEEAR
jgi:long-chain acyl-CoA synthetase